MDPQLHALLIKIKANPFLLVRFENHARNCNSNLTLKLFEEILRDLDTTDEIREKLRVYVVIDNQVRLEKLWWIIKSAYLVKPLNTIFHPYKWHHSLTHISATRKERSPLLSTER